MREPASCPGCGAEEGKLHRDGCDLASTGEAGRRLPYIAYSTFCAKCGAQEPPLFKVPDEVWAYYIEPEARGYVICRQCFDYIRQVIDAHQGPPRFGDFDLQTDRQLWAACYGRIIRQAEDAGQPAIAAYLRAQAEQLDRGLARDEEES